MRKDEFQIQRFKTEEQWKSGLLCSLKMSRGIGLTIPSVPTFTRWMKEPKNPVSLAVCECGSIYFVESENHQLILRELESGISETLPCLGRRGEGPGQVSNLGRLICNRFSLWLLDKGNREVLAFSRESCQIKYEIAGYREDDIEMAFKKPVDIAIDQSGNLYVLDRESCMIFKYDRHGNYMGKFGSRLKKPVGLAIGKENKVFVVDRDYHGFLVFTAEKDEPETLGNFAAIDKDFDPTFITADKNGLIFVIDRDSSIHEFDSDGSYLGKIDVPGLNADLCCLAVDSKDNLYAGTGSGIAVLSSGTSFAKTSGTYYSKTLDSGIQGCQWHRLALEADLPDNTVLSVYYHSSDDEGLKTTLDDIFESQKNVQEKAGAIERKMPARVWTGPETNPKDMLFRSKTGRYLWLKITFDTLDENVSPTLKGMMVFYPRISYLRYLPSIYQEDPVSKDFLERFLSIFETFFYGIETEIDELFRYFDPSLTPPDFLPWLASWLDLALEEDWPEEKKRLFISEAMRLYKLKGTPAGIVRILQIYTGRKAFIIEHSLADTPVVIGGKRRLGVDSLLIGTPVRGFRLGDDSILGRVAIRDVVQAPEDPFLPLAYRFTVLVDLPPDEFARAEKILRRVIDEWKPAHTDYRLRPFSGMKTGLADYVGINTLIAGYGPPRVGITSTLGSFLVETAGEQGGRMEQRSSPNKNLRLI